MAATYSGGMRRKLDLAMTLVGKPRIIFLDEPTTGLDPRSRRTMWDIIRQLVAEGVTIFLTTQYLDEADRLADRIAVLDQGKLVAQGTPAELKRQIPGSHVRLRFAGDRRTRRRAAGPDRLHAGRRGGPDLAGPQRWWGEIGSGPAGTNSTPTRSRSRSSRCTRRTSMTSSLP